MANEKISYLTETTFKISNMVCEGCGEKITTILKGLTGVKEVNAKKPFKSKFMLVIILSK